MEDATYKLFKYEESLTIFYIIYSKLTLLDDLPLLINEFNKLDQSNNTRFFMNIQVLEKIIKRVENLFYKFTKEMKNDLKIKRIDKEENTSNPVIDMSKKILNRLELYDNISEVNTNDNNNSSLTRIVKDIKFDKIKKTRMINGSITHNNHNSRIIIIPKENLTNFKLNKIKSTKLPNQANNFLGNYVNNSTILRMTNKFFYWIKSFIPNFKKFQRSNAKKNNFNLYELRQTLINILKNSSNKTLNVVKLKRIFNEINAKWKKLDENDKKNFRPIKSLIDKVINMNIKQVDKVKLSREEHDENNKKPILLYPLNNNDAIITNYKFNSTTNYHIISIRFIKILLKLSNNAYLKEIFVTKYLNKNGIKIILTGTDSIHDLYIFLKNKLIINFNKLCNKNDKKYHEYSLRKCKRKINNNILFYGKYRLIFNRKFLLSIILLFKFNQFFNKHNYLNIQKLNREYNSLPSRFNDPSLPTQTEIPSIIFSNRFIRKTKRFSIKDGEWNYWLEWSSCNVKCNIGERKRFRKCIDKTFGKIINKNNCQGNDFEISTCVEKSCSNGYITYFYYYPDYCFFFSQKTFNLQYQLGKVIT